MICKSIKKFKDVKSSKTDVKYSVYVALTEDNEEKWLLCEYNNRNKVLTSCDVESNPTPEDMIDWFFGAYKDIE